MPDKNQQNQQEILFKLSLIEQQMQGLHQQLHAVEKGIIELETLDFGLDEFAGSEGKKIIAPLGKGIFVKAKIISEDLIVDIGNKTLIKKNIKETQELIKKQIEKLIEAKKDINKNLETTSKEAERIVEGLEGKN